MKKLTYCRLIFSLLISLPFISQAQQYSLASDKLSGLITPASASDRILFKDSIYFSATDFFVQRRAAFELTPQDEMRLIKNTTDKTSGLNHWFFQQYHAGVAVFHAQVNVHEKSNLAKRANGKLVRALHASSAAFLNEETALATAVKDFSASHYWQKGIVRKVFVPADFDFENLDPAAMVLCYELELQTDVKRKGTDYFIDANTGRIVGTLPTIYNCNPTSAATVWYGNKTINTTYKSNVNKYFLQDDCTTKVEVLIGKNGRIRDTVFSGVGSNTWASNTNAVTALWVAKRTVAYYSSVHSRISWDDLGHRVVFVIDDPGCTDNTCTLYNAYAGDTITFGNYGSAALADDYYALDVFGHEFTHNVTYNAIPGGQGLIYNRESGALNESFSDILGNTTEMWEEGVVTGDIWKVGEDRTNAGGGLLWLRDMANPNNVNPNTFQSSMQPKKYKDVAHNWQNATSGCTPNNGNDQCGVHTNSGVQNYMFYLLSVGGTGVNEGTPFNVTGITVIKSRAIAYAVLTGGYLTGTSNYLASRNAWIQAAEDLYGVCSNEAIQTAKAWYAVGADIDSPFYDRQSGCVNLNSNAGLTITGGINSYTLASGGCGIITQTATNNPLIFQAGNFISVKSAVALRATGTQPLIIAPSDCAYSNF